MKFNNLAIFEKLCKIFWTYRRLQVDCRLECVNQDFPAALQHDSSIYLVTATRHVDFQVKYLACEFLQYPLHSVSFLE